MNTFTVKIPLRTRLLMVAIATNELRGLRGTQNDDPESCWAMRRLWGM